MKITAILLLICFALVSLISCETKINAKSATPASLAHDNGVLPRFTRAQYNEDIENLKSAAAKCEAFSIVFLDKVNPITQKHESVQCDQPRYISQFADSADLVVTEDLNVSKIDGEFAVESEACGECFLGECDHDEAPCGDISKLVRMIRKKGDLLKSHIAVLKEYAETVSVFSERYARGAFAIVEEDGSVRSDVITIAGMVPYSQKHDYSLKLAEIIGAVHLNCVALDTSSLDEKALDRAESKCRMKVSDLLSALNGEFITSNPQ